MTASVPLGRRALHEMDRAVTRRRTNMLLGALAAVMLLANDGAANDGAASDGAASDGAASELVDVPSALITIIDTVEVAAPSPGVLKRVPAREGTMVVTGQVLAQVDDRAAALKAAQAELQFQLASDEAASDIAARLAKKTHEVAVQELERARNRNRKLPNSVSAAEVALTQLAADRTALELENAMHKQGLARITSEMRASELELAEHEKQQFTVLSPINGMVVHVEKRAGEYVDTGETVARVVRVDRVRAEGFAPAGFTVSGLLGRRATLRISRDDQLIDVEGVVVFVSPEADPVNQEVPIWAEFANPKLMLRPGLRGSMFVHPQPATETEPSASESRSDAKRTSASLR